MASEEQTMPPPPSPPEATPLKVEPADPPKRSPISRPGTGTVGQPIQLLSNHFKVKLNAPDAVLYHYNVSIKYEDQCAVEGKGIGRKVVDKLYQTYSTDLAGKQFAYDGEKSLFTVGPLPRNKFDYTVILEDSYARDSRESPSDGSPNQSERKRSKCSHLPRTFMVEISFAAMIPLNSSALALTGGESEHNQDALRVLHIMLRQQQAKRGCLLVRQSFFSEEHTSFNVGGGIKGLRGFHSSFCSTEDGLSLNMDVSTTMILTPGPVDNFLLANQNLRDRHLIDWAKAKRMLKNMRVKTRHTKMEFKIIGLSELPCNRQLFPLKVRNSGGEDHTVDITVYDYFTRKKIELTWSSHVPCLDVGKPKHPNYLPMELCELVPLQRYTKALSSQQRASLMDNSRQKPPEQIRVVTDAVRNNRYDEDPLLSSCGIFIEKQFTQLDARVLSTPTLKLGNQEDYIPRNGRWNFNNKRLWAPAHIKSWGIVNFSAHCDISYLSREIINCGRNKGIRFERPQALIEEDRRWGRSGPVIRVDRMFDLIKPNFTEPPQFLLCVLPEKKNSVLYGPWKKKNLAELGIVTQCVAPTKITDQYLTNVILKINAKLGGTNSLLAVEHTLSLPMINMIPTMILGMDVSHGQPGRSDIPSVAAVVGSRNWPLISKYRASVRTQPPKVEMIDSLYKPLPNGNDDGIIRELLLDFYSTSGSRKPSQIIIFRDGVSESQFDQVLNVELNQIMKAYRSMGEGPLPKFTVIVAQKNHHTKLFRAGAPDNVPPGTVVDTKVVHPRHYDFYMCAQAGMIGTSRPTHYHVLLDEINFAPDDLQNLVHSLSYVYQRSTVAVSVVAPVCYAHLAALQMSQFIKFEDFSEVSSGQGGDTTAGASAIPELPRLHENVSSSMFFC